jgi:integrase
VFTSTIGTVMEPRRVNTYFARACARAGIGGHTFHGLRHDFGSLLLAAGVPTRVVQEMLGHANSYITMGRYQHVPDELQRDAAERLDAVLGSMS